MTKVSWQPVNPVYQSSSESSVSWMATKLLVGHAIIRDADAFVSGAVRKRYHTSD